jgi:penicillin-binding protein 1A
VAEAAMLAGLPKAPSAYNPISNPKRARIRQLYIIERMEENGFITAAQAEAAKKELLIINRPRQHARACRVRGRDGRQLIFAQYGDEAYTRGLNVYTTINAADQDAAYKALRKGIMDYERRQVYRGPESSSTCRRPEGARRRHRRRAGRPPRQRRRAGGRGAGGHAEEDRRAAPTATTSRSPATA